MNEKLLQEYKKSIFYNVLCKLKNFFFWKKQEKENYSETREEPKEKKEKVEFLKDVKVETVEMDKNFEQKQFMKNLEEKPELLEKFSTERLEKILQYYLEENEKKRELIKKLSNQE